MKSSDHAITIKENDKMNIVQRTGFIKIDVIFPQNGIIFTCGNFCSNKDSKIRIQAEPSMKGII